MSKYYIISVMSEDRPGIIADITGVVYELGGDLAELNQSVLCGYLTMILIVSFDETVSTATLLNRIQTVDSPTPFDVVARELDGPRECTHVSLPEKTYIVTAQGQNKKGLVHGISSFCYRRNINILDLATTKTKDTYTMILQIDLSKVPSIAEVRESLQQFATDTGLHVVMQHHNLFKVTNEIPF